MRYELSDYEWTAIKPMLPNKPRGIRRVNDRRVLNGIFWVLRSGAPWRDLPETYGPRTTCYNRFVRWRRAGVWDQIMDALAAGHDAAVQMIDTSVVRVHQHGACIANNNHQDMGRSRGGARFTRWWTPTACRSISLLRRAKRMTIGCVRFSSAPCFHKRCYSRIVDTTRTGSGSLPASKEHGRTFHRNEIAKIRSASARTCIVRGT
jgi:transposase